MLYTRIIYTGNLHQNSLQKQKFVRKGHPETAGFYLWNFFTPLPPRGSYLYMWRWFFLELFYPSSPLRTAGFLDAPLKDAKIWELSAGWMRRHCSQKYILCTNNNGSIWFFLIFFSYDITLWYVLQNSLSLSRERIWFTWLTLNGNVTSS